jgi:hypothetical protein
MNLNNKPMLSVKHVIGLLLMMWIAPSFAADERPDFSGVWDRYFGPGESGFGGFGGPQEELPFTTEGKRRSDEYQQLVAASQDNPGAFCVTYGMPAMMENVGGYPLEIIQRPEQITLIYEVEGEARRVFMDDNALPEERRFPNRQGYSAGYWEDKVLVVETTSLTDGQDQLAHPHSDQARISERFSLDTNDAGTRIISYELVLTDPVYYTEPVTVSRKWQPLENGQLLPYNCPEEPWLKLLDMRRQQLQAGEPVTATMSDVYATEMYESE